MTTTIDTQKHALFYSYALLFGLVATSALSVHASSEGRAALAAGEVRYNQEDQEDIDEFFAIFATQQRQLKLRIECLALTNRESLALFSRIMREELKPNIDEWKARITSGVASPEQIKESFLLYMKTLFASVTLLVQSCKALESRPALTSPERQLLHALQRHTQSVLTGIRNNAYHEALSPQPVVQTRLKIAYYQACIRVYGVLPADFRKCEQILMLESQLITELSALIGGEAYITQEEHGLFIKKIRDITQRRIQRHLFCNRHASPAVRARVRASFMTERIVRIV